MVQRAAEPPPTLKLRTRLALAFILGLAVLVALAVYADVSRLTRTFAAFRWAYIPLVLALTFVNYTLRFVKWHFYIRQIGVRALSLVDSLGIFVSCFTMVMTPAKLGEFLKSYLLKQVTGTPMSRSAPVIVAERLTDGLAMVILATVGLFTYHWGREIMILVTALLLGFVAVVEHRPLALRLLKGLQVLPFFSRFAKEWESLYESAYILFTLQNLLIAIALGLVCWGAECVAFYLVLLGLGLTGGASLLLQASFILATSTILGAISFLPGGLGVVDASLTGLTLLLMNVERSLAVAAAIIIRLATLWLGTIIGLLTFFLFRRKFFEAAR